MSANEGTYDGMEFNDNVLIKKNCNNSGGSLEVENIIYSDTFKSYSLNTPILLANSIFNSEGSVIITSSSPVNSCTTTSASLIVNGGVLINKDSVFKGVLRICNTTNTYDNSTGSLIISGGASINQNLSLNGILNVFNSTSSTSTSGSIITLGGITISNSTNSTNISNGGALTVIGGASFLGDIRSNNFYSNFLTVTNGNFLSITSYNLLVSNGDFINISSNNLISTNISGSNVYINNLNSLNTTISNLYSDYASFGNTIVLNENITNLSVSNLYNNIGYIDTFNSTIGNIDFLTVGNLYVINNIEYNDIVTNLSSSNIISNFTSIGSLQLTIGTFGSLHGILGSSFIYSDVISTTNLSSANLTVSNAVINQSTISNLQVTGSIPSYNSTTGTLLNQGGISVNCTVNSVSISSGGSGTFAGGLAVNKDVYIGGNTFLTGYLDLNQNNIFNVTSPSFNLNYNTQASLGLVVANKFYVDQRFNSFTIGNISGNLTAGQVVIASTTGNIRGYPTFTFDGTTLTLNSTVDATSLTNGGTLQIYGGASIEKNLFVGGNGHILGYLDMNNQKITSVATPTTAYDAVNKYYVDSTIANGFTTANIFVSGTAVLPTSILTNSTIIGTSHSYNSSTGSIILLNGGLSINDTYNSSSTTFGGAFTVAGGAAFGSDIYTQGITYFKNTTDSNSTTSGSVLISGGLGVKANISVNAMILPSIIPPIYNNIVNNTSQFYVDTNDNLFKSVTTTSGTLTTYQPTNTKGDLLTHNGITQVRLPVGVNGQILTVNSNTVNGIQWSTGSNKSNQIYLVGNDNSTTCIIIQKSEGAFVDCVYPIIKYGPSANFFFTKSFSSQYGHIIINNGNRSSDNGILLAEYNPYQGIELYKTTNGSNGLYIENSNQLFLGTTIQLTSTNLTTTNFLSTYGAYFISISAQNNGPAATFIITKSDPSLNSCQITKISSSPGTNNCNLYIQWYSLSPFGIYKTTNDDDDFYTIIDNFPNINVFTITLTDINTVYLQKNMFNFYEKKSFFIKITYNSINGPCSIFSMSKNYHTNSGNKTTYQSPGKTTLEKIIFNWDSNSLPSISKTGSNYNGIYNVEISIF